MLWFIQHYLWDLSNAPDIRREEIEAFEFGYNVVNEDLARAVVEEIEGAEEPVVMVHDYHLYTLPALVRRARPDAFLHHFVHIPWTQSDAWRVLPAAGARRDLQRPAGQRHHRLPHALLPAQLPAVLPRPDGLRGRLRARASCAAATARCGCAPTRCRSTAGHALDRRARARSREFERELLRPPARLPDPARRPRRPVARTCCAASPRSTCSSSSTPSSARRSPSSRS